MKVFVLEDSPQRKWWFWGRFEGHDLTLIDSCEKKDRFDGPYELILLDHDLGGRQMVDHEDSGLAFVKEMKERFVDALVIIHSFNPGGAEAMQQEHPVSFIAPFGSRAFLSLIDMVEEFEKDLRDQDKVDKVEDLETL